MPKQLLSRIGFVRGVKPSLDPAIVPEDALWQGYNIASDINGMLRIRTGYEAVTQNLGLGSVQALFKLNDIMYFIWQGELYKIQNNSAIKVSDTSLGSNIPSVVNWAFGGSPVAYIFTGNGLYQTNGTTVTAVTPYTPGTGEASNLLSTNVSKCTIGLIRASYSQRFVATGNPDYPNEVYLSAPLNPAYFPADEVIKLPDDGGKIVGIALWYNTLVIFRDKDIYMFSGADVKDVNAMLVLQCPVGCIAGRTIVPIPEYGVMFLGKDAVYKLTGVDAIEGRVSPLRVSDDIAVKLKESLSAGVDGVCAVYYDNEYRLSIPKHRNSTFRLKDTEWHIDTGQPIGNFLVFDNVLYGANWFFGEVYKYSDVLYDNQIGYNLQAISKRDIFTTGEVRVTRMFLYVLHSSLVSIGNQYFFGDTFNTQLFNTAVREDVDVASSGQQQLKVSVFVDGKEYNIEDFNVIAKQVQVPNTDLPMPLIIYEKRFTPMIKGNSVQVKIESLRPGEDIAILGYAFEYMPKQYLKGSEV